MIVIELQCVLLLHITFYLPTSLALANFIVVVVVVAVAVAVIVYLLTSLALANFIVVVVAFAVAVLVCNLPFPTLCYLCLALFDIFSKCLLLLSVHVVDCC